MGAQEMAALLPPTDTIEAWLAQRSSLEDHMRGRNRRAIVPEAVSARSMHHLLRTGLEAARRLENDTGKEVVTEEEETGLEALVLLVGRPALRIIDGRFESPPPGWDVLEHYREHLQRAITAVGRIELEGHPVYPWAGTGFLVAPDLVMTNRHVVKAFSSQRASGTWFFQPGVNVSVDHAEEPDRDSPAFRKVIEIAGVHERLDLALLRIESEEEIPPLRVMSEEIDQSTPRLVATIGYPANDPRNDPSVMAEIFGDVYGVKRLQPGQISEYFPEDGVLRHDCSTLGGNSGSCVVDLLSGDVIGLHFRGFYMKYNEAVTLPWLKEDPLLVSTGAWIARERTKISRPRGVERLQV